MPNIWASSTHDAEMERRPTNGASEESPARRSPCQRGRRERQNDRDNSCGSTYALRYLGNQYWPMRRPSPISIGVCVELQQVDESRAAPAIRWLERIDQRRPPPTRLGLIRAARSGLTED